MDALVSAIISGGLALIGTIMTVQASTKKTEITLQTELAVMRTELTGLRDEVRKHNGFAERIPRLESQFESFEKLYERDIKRVEDAVAHD